MRHFFPPTKNFPKTGDRDKAAHATKASTSGLTINVPWDVCIVMPIDKPEGMAHAFLRPFLIFSGKIAHTRGAFKNIRHKA
jgi:hypothetical protein